MTPKYSSSCSIFSEFECYSCHDICTCLGEIAVVFVDFTSAGVGGNPGICFILFVKEVVDRNIYSKLFDEFRFEDISNTQAVHKVRIDRTVFGGSVVDVLTAYEL